MSKLSSYAQAIKDYYAVLEPGQSDTWNPLIPQWEDIELYHRLTLFRELVYALRLVDYMKGSFKILDFGCGNGRSTRMYIDLGFNPNIITGIDIRSNAVEVARKSNPSINFLVSKNGNINFEDGYFSWLSMCTVASSIQYERRRKQLCNEAVRVLKPGGHLFFWDMLHVLQQIGGEDLDPEKLFPNLELVEKRHVNLYGEISRLMRKNFRKSFFKSIISRMQKPPTHQSVLFRKPT